MREYYQIIKSIIRKTPVKKILYPGTFISAVFFHFLIQTIERGKLEYELNIWLFIIPLVMLILIGFILGAIRLVKELENADSSSKKEKVVEKQSKNLKKLPELIEIKTKQDGEIEWVINILRAFTPLDASGKEEFIKALRISSPRCFQCKSNIGSYSKRMSHSHRLWEIYTCKNNKCPNHLKLLVKPETMKIKNEQIEVEVKGEIRKEIGKYWKKYCDIYNGYTGGSYDEFEPPLDGTQYTPSGYQW